MSANTRDLIHLAKALALLALMLFSLITACALSDVIVDFK